MKWGDLQHLASHEEPYPGCHSEWTHDHPLQSAPASCLRVPHSKIWLAASLHSDLFRPEMQIQVVWGSGWFACYRPSKCLQSLQSQQSSKPPKIASDPHSALHCCFLHVRNTPVCLWDLQQQLIDIDAAMRKHRLTLEEVLNANLKASSEALSWRPLTVVPSTQKTKLSDQWLKTAENCCLDSTMLFWWSKCQWWLQLWLASVVETYKRFKRSEVDLSLIILKRNPTAYIIQIKSCHECLCKRSVLDAPFAGQNEAFPRSGWSCIHNKLLLQRWM